MFLFSYRLQSLDVIIEYYVPDFHMKYPPIITFSSQLNKV